MHLFITLKFVCWLYSNLKSQCLQPVLLKHFSLAIYVGVMPPLSERWQKLLTEVYRGDTEPLSVEGSSASPSDSHLD